MKTVFIVAWTKGKNVVRSTKKFLKSNRYNQLPNGSPNYTTKAYEKYDNIDAISTFMFEFGYAHLSSCQSSPEHNYSIGYMSGDLIRKPWNRYSCYYFRYSSLRISDWIFSRIIFLWINFSWFLAYKATIFKNDTYHNKHWKYFSALEENVKIRCSIYYMRR